MVDFRSKNLHRSVKWRDSLPELNSWPLQLMLCQDWEDHTACLDIPDTSVRHASQVCALKWTLVSGGQGLAAPSCFRGRLRFDKLSHTQKFGSYNTVAYITPSSACLWAIWRSQPSPDKDVLIWQLFFFLSLILTAGNDMHAIDFLAAFSRQSLTSTVSTVSSWKDYLDILEMFATYAVDTKCTSSSPEVFAYRIAWANTSHWLKVFCTKTYLVMMTNDLSVYVTKVGSATNVLFVVTLLWIFTCIFKAEVKI